MVVENQTVFEACCRGEVGGARESLVIWSGGYPGRAVRRVWADLDLHGVRIARIVSDIAGGDVRPYRMGPEEVYSARVVLPLTSEERQDIEADLNAQPSALLSETLEALIAREARVEQEAQLAAGSV